MKRILARAWVWLLCTTAITAVGTMAVLTIFEAVKGNEVARAIVFATLVSIGVLALVALTVWAVENYDD